MNFPTILGLGCGLVVVIVILVTVAEVSSQNEYWENAKRLAKEGTPFRATVRSIQRFDGYITPRYAVNAGGINPATGKYQEFQGPAMGEVRSESYPSKWRVGDPIWVYLDPQNPNNYFVDATNRGPAPN